MSGKSNYCLLKDTYKNIENFEETKTIGFIVLRHVNSVLTNKYWVHCYKSIRKYYPENYIIIIDDNSDYKFITHENLYKTKIINSEYPKRGELLPYIYYLRNKLFDTAVIIHDSVFINKYIDFTVDKYKIIWQFDHDWDQIEDETRLIKVFNDPELLDFYRNKKLWKGCFGAMTVINYDFLEYINSKYDMSKLLNHIISRYNRCSFERVIACILQKEYKKETLFGDIHNYMRWGTHFDKKKIYNYLPLVKVWTGR
jgi:hypothetical protein